MRLEPSRALRLLPWLAEEGVAQLRAQWRQHLLTLIGLVWGSSAVVLLLGFGAGFHGFLDLGFKKTGDRYTAVVGEYTSSRTGGARPGRPVKLTLDDYERVRASTGSASRVAAEIQAAQRTFRTPLRTRTGVMSAATPDLRDIKMLRVAHGRFYDEEDVRLGRAVAVLGANLPAVFFGGGDPLGRTIQVDGMPFRVIGVLERKGQQIMINNALHDDMLFVPLSAGQRVLGLRDEVADLLLQPRALDAIPVMHAELRAVLWPAHHVPLDDGGAFRVQSVTEFTGPILTIARGLTLLLGVVGTVTLALAGVGVANLMIAIVNGRRVELAMRRACGARRGDVVLQLLIETLAIVLGGGVLGIGLSATLLLGLALLPLPEFMPVPEIHPSVLATTLGVLVAVGLASGVAPARLAARVDPASALRST